MATNSKILYVITQSEWGGATRYVFDLSTQLVKQGKDVHVICGEGGELIEKLKQEDVNCHVLSSIKREINPWHDLLSTLKLAKLYLEIKPDIIHLNSSKVSIIGTAASVIAKIFGQRHKLVYTAHGFVFNEPLPSSVKIFYIFAERITAPFKQKIICVSEYDKATAISNKIASTKKLITIHNASQQLNFLSKEQARKDLNLSTNKFIIGCIANYYPSKGLTYLFDATKQLTEKIPNLTLTIIGSGNKKSTEAVNLYVKKSGLENYVNLVTDKPKEAHKYITAFDIYCLPSVKEGLPYALLEAKQAGLPIVSTMVGGIPEIISHNNTGLLVAPANSVELAGAILKLYHDKNLSQTLATNAKNQSNSFDAMISETKNAYEL
jgi:glycosyltransferase involved in cell wall biosynthesis